MRGFLHYISLHSKNPSNRTYCIFVNNSDLCVVHANKFNTSNSNTIKILILYCPTCQQVLNIIQFIVRKYFSFERHGMCEIHIPYFISWVRLYKITQYSSMFLWRMLLMMKCSGWNTSDSTGISACEVLHLRILSKGSEWNKTILITTFNTV